MVQAKEYGSLGLLVSLEVDEGDESDEGDEGEGEMHFNITANHNLVGLQKSTTIQNPGLDVAAVVVPVTQSHKNMSLFEVPSSMKFNADATILLDLPGSGEFSKQFYLLSQGETVFKMGASTGLTTGVYAGWGSATHKKQHIIVASPYNSFTEKGDSGSVYWIVLKNAKGHTRSVPIAIHVSSFQIAGQEGKTAFGIPITMALEVLFGDKTGDLLPCEDCHGEHNGGFEQEGCATAPDLRLGEHHSDATRIE